MKELTFEEFKSIYVGLSPKSKEYLTAILKALERGEEAARSSLNYGTQELRRSS